MNRKRFLSTYQNLTSQEQNVYDTVPMEDSWSENQIARELVRQNRNLPPEALRRCIMRLKDSGLVRQTENSRWVRVAVNAPMKPAKVKEEPAPVATTNKTTDEKPLLERMAESAQLLRNIANEFDAIAIEVEERMDGTEEEAAKLRQLKSLLKEI